MLQIRMVFVLGFLLSLGISQGRMNGIGVGHFNEYQGIKNAVSGAVELAPSFKKNVSLTNPSTWHNLKFAYLSISYSGNENVIRTPSTVNGYSSLSNALWVVPIKSNSSIGLSLSPYSDQRLTIVGDTSYFQAFDSTFGYTRSFERSGGILSFKISSSLKVSDRASLGINHSILFGSSRQNESITFGGSSIIQSSRAKYNGIVNDFFISVILMNDLTSYFKYTFSLKPLESAIEQKHLFDDTNGNGYHDFSTTGFDFPFPDSVSASLEEREKDIHNPNGFKLGLNKSFGEKIALAFEIGTLNDIAENQDKFLSTLSTPIYNWIEKTNSLVASFSYFPENYSLRFFDKFSFKSGLIHRMHIMKYDEMDIEELGFSFGVGFKFKPVGNQINLNYYFGNRKFSNISEKEFIQQIQMGISLGDIWFVKRRQK